MTLSLILDKWETDVLNKRFAVVGFDESQHESSFVYDRELLLKDAREYMSKLPMRQARVCHLYYTEGHSQLEIAEALDTTVKAVESVLGRVNKKLKERYGT